MAVKMFDRRERSMLSDSTVAESYAKYLQEHFTSQRHGANGDVDADHVNALNYEEFKEYHVLRVIGRGNEFSDNLARDYQYTEVLKEKLLSGN